jgi:hypothetical protein
MSPGLLDPTEFALSIPAPQSGPKPLSSFVRLSSTVQLYEPAAGSIAPESSPTTILFCSWMNAIPKHIEYYTRTYQKVYPSARIILISINTIEFLFHSETRRRAAIAAAVSALLSQDQIKERLLIHSLSNGGGKRVYGVAGAYRAATGQALPATAWVIDSSPGIPRFRRDIYALSVPAEKWPLYLRAPYMAIVVLTGAVVYVTVNWMPRWFWRELVWGPIEGMNDPELVDQKCVRGYIYSKEDLAIDWRDVEMSAAVAERRKFPVMKELIDGAQHVQMFKGRGGEEGYWGFLNAVWKRGLEELRQ